MGRLINSASSGKSEVLETLHWEGAISGGVQLFRIGTLVSHRWHSDEDRQGDDPQLEADVLSVLGTLQGLGYVEAHDDKTGAVADLTASPAATVRVRLTASGREQGRHPRPRPDVDPWGRH